MGKTIPVTPAQVAGAQFLVKQAELGGPAVVNSMRQLARTKRKQEPRRVARTPVARPPVSPEAARWAYDGPSGVLPAISAERVEVVRGQAAKHGVEVHETYD